MSQRTVAIIPARYNSSRFPGKPLALIDGKPMIQWAWESSAKCPEINEIIVATDDQRIMECVENFGGKAMMTSDKHRSGTDRIAEVVKQVKADLIVNVQGDEPLMPASVLSQLLALMRDPKVEMASVAVPFRLSSRNASDPNAVKVVLDAQGNALYFSRSLIPFPRSGGLAVEPLLHWGLYAYSHACLFRFVQWPVGQLENCEMLEQLRALENGVKIRMLVTDRCSIGVDVPADIAEVEKLLAEKGTRQKMTSNEINTNNSKKTRMKEKLL